jgi:hypothetical protein
MMTYHSFLNSVFVHISVKCFYKSGLSLHEQRTTSLQCIRLNCVNTFVSCVAINQTHAACYWVAYMKPLYIWNSDNGLILQTFPSVNILFFWALTPCQTLCGVCQAKPPTSYLIWFQSWPFSCPLDHAQGGNFCHLTVYVRQATLALHSDGWCWPSHCSR